MFIFNCCSKKLSAPSHPCQFETKLDRSAMFMLLSLWRKCDTKVCISRVVSKILEFCFSPQFCCFVGQLQ